MKKSPVYPKYETSAFGGDGFDPRVDFSPFLEEAKHRARVVDFQSSPLYPEERGKKTFPENKQVGKKSWKNHVFSWWKTDKGSKPRVGSTSSSYINFLPKRHHLVSGPIHGSHSTKNKNDDGRHWRPSPGRLNGLFNPTKRVKNETTYMCLHELDRTQVLQTYGPVYLVT